MVCGREVGGGGVRAGEGGNECGSWRVVVGGEKVIREHAWGGYATGVGSRIVRVAKVRIM